MTTEAVPASGARRQQGETSVLRQRLRHETHTQHERLDGCFSGMMEVGGFALYRRFIRMNEACHAAIEPRLMASELPRVAADWASRERAGVLAADLRAMGLPPLSPLAFPIEAPDLAEAVGIAYVLEGSRLGARFMLRAAARVEGREGWERAAFGFLAGADEPDYFGGFMKRADGLVVGESARQRTVAAANVTFAYFLDTEQVAAQEDGGR